VYNIYRNLQKGGGGTDCSTAPAPAGVGILGTQLPKRSPSAVVESRVSSPCQCFFIGIFVCSQSGDQPLEDVENVGDHPQEDLAKSGYKPKIK
jgi:hypothetical protein